MLCANTHACFQKYVFSCIISRFMSRNRSENIYQLSPELFFFFFNGILCKKYLCQSEVAVATSLFESKFERRLLCLFDLVTLFNGKQVGW